ncbi:porin [Xylophilus sp.]|uniref:porin n=1 Tax=Xylophilus sp. TaxID=2653893 RepID=UPI0013BAA1DB|nr:porin [Xylophilus sp.]KAF1043723.1 MAG: Outer membrane porin protein [Xylophilus sp.]
MRKLVMAGAALCCVPVYAQTSNLTLYGIIDLGVRRASGLTAGNAPGSGSTSSLASGADNTSRWGIRGRANLGGGLEASFALESGIAVDTGAPLNSTKYFDRASWLGLSGSWGTLTAGRQIVLLADSVVAVDPLGLRFAGINPNIVTSALNAHGLGIEFGSTSSTTSSYRLDNSLKYVNTVGRLTFSAMYGFGEASGSTSSLSSKGAGVQYSHAGLTVSGAYQTFRAADTRELDGYVAGAAYRIGSWRLAASAARSQGDTTATTKTKQRVYSAGATWSATTAVDLTAAAYELRRDRTGLVDDGYLRLIAFGEYKLSKRSKLFAEVDTTRWRRGYQGAANRSRANGITIGIGHSF